MIKKYLKKELEVGGRVLTVEVNKVAPQANVSVIARYGDTEVLATVVSGPAKTNQGFFPLTVDFVERLYAGGIIKGSRWVKREGRGTDEAILTGRLIDRSIRPLFPKDFQDEVQVVVTLLSTDGVNDHDVLSIVATSLALAVSDIPWNGPIGAVRVGFVTTPEESFVVNPHLSEMEFSDLDLIVSADKDGLVMVEAGAKQLPEEKMAQAIKIAQEEVQGQIKFINEIRQEIGQDKYHYQPRTINKELLAEIDKNHGKEILQMAVTNDPLVKPSDQVINALKTNIAAAYPDHADKNQIPELVELILRKHIRRLAKAKDQRVDGRSATEIRPVTSEVGLLPRTHGSALFQRGLTQILSVVTLASPSLQQYIETAEGMEEKRYIHHYNDNPYALGETGRLGGPGRREIGHGALAERALFSVIPQQDKFPYTIRVVSEVLSSNGSTSMGSTCGSTLALMDAGVPILAPVSGIAMGLIAESADDYLVLSDISGFEDFYGNMDFKVAGTQTGITALQLDIKISEGFHGLTAKMVADIFAQAREGRLQILQTMLKAIPTSRQNVSRYAPKVATIKVPVDKIGEIIGPGGRNIKNIIATTTAAVDIEDDGTVTISSIDPQAVEKALAWIDGMTREVQVGEEFEGEVKRILPFGAFVEILPGKEGLVHVSRMAAGFISDPSQVVKIGQKVKVKVHEIDELGRVNLSMYWGPKEPMPSRPAAGMEGTQGQEFPQARFGGERRSRPFGPRRLGPPRGGRRF